MYTQNSFLGNSKEKPLFFQEKLQLGEKGKDCKLQYDAKLESL